MTFDEVPGIVVHSAREKQLFSLYNGKLGNAPVVSKVEITQINAGYKRYKILLVILEEEGGDYPKFSPFANLKGVPV